MAYGTANVDVIQSSTANTPVQFNDGNGTQVGTLCRAWVEFNGVTTATIRASFNVSSVTRNGTGYYTVNFTTAMADANYAVSGSASPPYGVRYSGGITVFSGTSAVNEVAPTTSAFNVITADAGGNIFDSKYVSVAVFR